MTLYYSLVFLLLVFEMVVFMSLIIPMPFTWKRALFNFISENPLIAKLQYGLKITFIFILILFLDSVNRVYRVQVELHNVGKNSAAGAAAAVAGADRMEVQARKFYSQRNMYLCGFTLFLSLILNRTYVMILDVLRLEEENKLLKGSSKATGKSADKLDEAGGLGEIAGYKRKISKLEKELDQKDADLQAMKQQTKGLSDEYARLGDQVSAKDGTPKKDK